MGKIEVTTVTMVIRVIDYVHNPKKCSQIESR